MKYVIKLLKRPIKQTLTVLGIALALWIIFTIIGRVIGSISIRDALNYGRQDDILNTLRFALRSVLWDFAFISKLIFELSIVVLIAQLLYRWSLKWPSTNS